MNVAQIFFRYSLIATIVLLYGCGSGKDTSKNTTPIIAAIDLVDVIDDKVNVQLTIPKINSDTISYYLPKIIPGAYHNNNHGRFIDDFKASDGDGNSLPVRRINDNKWLIANAKKLNTISYWVNDTFDSEHDHDVFSPTGSNIQKDENFVVNLHAFIGYFNTWKERKYRILIKHPKFLEAATLLQRLNTQELSKDHEFDVDIFAMSRYADVVDSPIMYARPDRIIFTVENMEVLLSVYSPNKVHRAAQLMPELERMIRAQKKFLGNMNTTKKYSILLYLSPAKENDAKGFGALEHNSSTLVVLPESIPLQKLNEVLTDIVSHEFFHIVTPLQIHSKEIHYFDYNTPKMSKHIWLYEGTTEYFSLLFQINQGLCSKEEFFNHILKKIETSALFNDQQSFTEMSSNILKEEYQKEYRNVYEKGALISMCIDIIMREQSDGALGILDLIKALSDKYGSDTPFDDPSLFKTIKKISYPAVSDFLEEHVMGNTPIDYEKYLNKLGLIYSTIEVPSSYFIYEQQPCIKGSETGKEVVFTPGIPMNSFLKTLGIQGGDILVSINDKEYALHNIYDLFGDSNAWILGDEITAVIKRDGETLTLHSTVITPVIQKKVISSQPDATDKQTLLLKKWINE